MYLYGRSYPILGSPGRRVTKGEFLYDQNGSTILSDVLDRGPVEVSDLGGEISARFLTGFGNQGSTGSKVL